MPGVQDFITPILIEVPAGPGYRTPKSVTPLQRKPGSCEHPEITKWHQPGGIIDVSCDRCHHSWRTVVWQP